MPNFEACFKKITSARLVGGPLIPADIQVAWRPTPRERRDPQPKAQLPGVDGGIYYTAREGYDVALHCVKRYNLKNDAPAASFFIRQRSAIITSFADAPSAARSSLRCRSTTRTRRTLAKDNASGMCFMAPHSSSQ